MMKVPNAQEDLNAAHTLVSSSGPVAYRAKNPDGDAFLYFDGDGAVEVYRMAGVEITPLYTLPPVSNVSGWQPIDSAPRDKSAVIIAVPTRDRDDHIVGEAYFDPDCFEGGDWWWAGTANGDYASSPISDCNHHAPEFWQPMPSVPALSAARTEAQT